MWLVWAWQAAETDWSRGGFRDCVWILIETWVLWAHALPGVAVRHTRSQKGRHIAM